MSAVTIPLDGTIERRLLINYRLDAAVAQSLLPAPLRPQLVDGSAVAGICLIRLGALRPRGFRPRIGWRAENAAHRIAVEWDEAGGPRTGVYVPGRHSGSWLPIAVGGRIFPGVHRRARFDAVESETRIAVRMSSVDTNVDADVELTDEWHSSLFPTIDDASRFFRSGSVGWSPARHSGALEGLRLETTTWEVTAATPLAVTSSFFDGLPRGAATLDNVLVMRDIPIRWSSPGRFRGMTGN